jgi:hypothetical protein
MKKTLNTIVWAATLLLLVQSAQALMIDVSYTSAAGQTWTAQRQGVVAQAVSDWEGWISDPRTVAVELTFENAGANTYLAQWSGGGTFTVGTDIYPWTFGVDHTVRINTYYVDEVLSNHLWWDPSPEAGGDLPFSHWDALSVIRHEFGHMLGFSTGLYVDDFATGHESSRWQEHITGTTFDPDGLDVVLAGLGNLSHISDEEGDDTDDLMVPLLVNGKRRPISHLDHQMLSLAHGYAQIPNGDANRDGAVTDADYTIWADNYGASDATFTMGDFNADGAVTDADYTIWADQYGQTFSAVPEPASAAILLCAALTILRTRRRR